MKKILVTIATLIMLFSACSSDSSDASGSDSVPDELAFINSDPVSTDLSEQPVPTNNAEPITELIIDDIVEGDGAEAGPADDVEVQYVGVLNTNGTEFDSSWSRGQTFNFNTSGGVIQGWIQGVQGMKVGGRRQISIPSALAYGDAPNGDIPASSDLIFVVDLLDVK